MQEEEEYQIRKVINTIQKENEKANRTTFSLSFPHCVVLLLTNVRHSYNIPPPLFSLSFPSEQLVHSSQVSPQYIHVKAGINPPYTIYPYRVITTCLFSTSKPLLLLLLSCEGSMSLGHTPITYYYYPIATPAKPPSLFSLPFQSYQTYLLIMSLTTTITIYLSITYTKLPSFPPTPPRLFLPWPPSRGRTGSQLDRQVSKWAPKTLSRANLPIFQHKSKDSPNKSHTKARRKTLHSPHSFPFPHFPISTRGVEPQKTHDNKTINDTTTAAAARAAGNDVRADIEGLGYTCVQMDHLVVILPNLNAAHKAMMVNPEKPIKTPTFLQRL